MARPTARVLSMRLCLISCRFAELYRQFTLRPARFTTTSAPSTSFTHSPSDFASHGSTRHAAGVGVRLSTTTSCPSATNARASKVPT
jgi:hypothetical protein